jgi:hypothetical protein
MIRQISSQAVGGAGRRIAVALVAVLSLLATSAAVYAAGTGPDFAVTISPASQSMVAGYTTPPPGYVATYTVMLSPSNGFTGAVTLTAGNLPKSSSQTQITTANWTVNGTTLAAGQNAQVNVPAGSLGVAATLTIGGGQPAVGTYSPTVTATSTSGVTHTQSMTTIVVSQNTAYFGLWMSPASQTIAQGGLTSSTINIARSNWTGSVSLSTSGLPAGATPSLNFTSTTGATSTLTISTSASVAPGLYPITITGTGTTSSKTTLTQTASFVLAVQAASTTSASAPTVAAPNTSVTPSSALSAVTSAATGTVTFKVFGPQATAPTSCSGGTTVGTATVNGPNTYKPASGYTLTSSGGTYWWYASYSGDTYNNASNSSCGAGMASTVVQDFSIGTSGATSQTALTGGTSDDSATYTTSVTPIGGLPGTVALSLVSGLPSGANASFSPASTASTSTLTVDVGTNVQPGTYTLSVQGQATIAGTVVTHTTPVTLIVNPSQPFTISGNVPNALYPGAAAQTFAVTLTNPNSFPIKVTQFGSVGVQAPNASGCLSSWFKVTLPNASASPISVPANSSVAASASIQMLDPNVNQDACKGQQLKLTYTGSYTK